MTWTLSSQKEFLVGVGQRVVAAPLGRTVAKVQNRTAGLCVLNRIHKGVLIRLQAIGFAQVSLSTSLNSFAHNDY